MAEYHKYIFDSSNRRFVGEFEEMYRQEKISNFDSWHQDDSRQLNRRIALDILSFYNFGKIVDVGSGKGILTHQLKRSNNHVLGIDISSTAVEVAKARFPDIEFEAADVNEHNFIDFLDRKYGSLTSEGGGGGIDLVFSAECLSYLLHWKRLIADFGTRARYLLINLYIPDNPIGFVSSAAELEDEVSQYFEILERVDLKVSRFVILFCRNRTIGA